MREFGDDPEQDLKVSAQSPQRVIVQRREWTGLLGFELFIFWVVFVLVFMEVFSHFVLAAFIGCVVVGILAVLLLSVTWLHYVLALVWSIGLGWVAYAFGGDWITIGVAGIVGLLIRMGMLAAVENNQKNGFGG